MQLAHSDTIPSRLQNLGLIVAWDEAIRVTCTECKVWRDVDTLALLRRTKNPNYRLIDRRCRCRLTPGCRGWNRFYWQAGVFRPLWTQQAINRWMAQDAKQNEAPGASPSRR